MKHLLPKNLPPSEKCHTRLAIAEDDSVILAVIYLDLFKYWSGLCPAKNHIWYC